MLDHLKLEHFRNLVSLSVVDGVIDDVERVALSKIAFSIGIPLDRLNVMLERASEYIYLIPQNQLERDKQLEEMIQFAQVDGQVSVSEVELIMQVGEKLGFSKDELNKRIESLIKKSPA
jgi:uncharacterized tellurite resistance protein B-like protein